MSQKKNDDVLVRIAEIEGSACVVRGDDAIADELVWNDHTVVAGVGVDGRGADAARGYEAREHDGVHACRSFDSLEHMIEKGLARQVHHGFTGKAR